MRYRMLKLDLGDARVWMDTAEVLYLRNVGNPSESRRRRIGYPHANELNVAAVCAGYAFELLFKVLARAGGGEPKAKHEPSAAYSHFKPTDRSEVDRILAQHGWNQPDELLEFLDKNLCDKDRKYWMRPRGGGDAKGTFYFSGRKTMDALNRLHEELSRFAIKQIGANPKVHEDWPGL